MSRARTCPTCRIRWQVSWLDPVAEAVHYNAIQADPELVKWLRNAARTFDEISDGRRFTAQEFFLWLEPDLTGRPHFPFYDGVEGGRPFELPQAGRMARGKDAA